MSRRWALIFALVVAALYLAAVNDLWGVKRDSALYLGLGQSLATGHGMEFNGGRWGGIPMGLPVIIAVCDRLFDFQYWPLNLLEKLLALGLIGVSYLAIRRLVQDLPERMRPGLVAASVVVIALSAQLLVNSTSILTDIPFSFFVLVGLYAFIRGRRSPWLWYGLGTAAMSAACLTRIVGPIFLAATAAAVLVEAVRRRSWQHGIAMVMYGAVGAAIFMAWFLLVRSQQDPGTLDYFQASANSMGFLSAEKWVLVGQAVLRIPMATSACFLDQRVAGLDWALAALALVGLWTAWRARQYLVVFPVVLYIGGLALLTPSSVADRYFLPIMPLLVYCIMLGAQTLTLWMKDSPQAARWIKTPAGWAIKTPGGMRVSALVAAVAVLCVLISMPKIGRELYWVHHPRFYDVYDNGQWKGYVEAGQYLRAHGRPEVDRVLAPQIRIIHHLSGLLVATEKDLPHLDLHHYDQNEPRLFMEAASSGDYRFVVVSTKCAGGTPEAERSAEIQRLMRTSGLFRDKPVSLTGLLVYELTALPVRSDVVAGDIYVPLENH
jgi:4-amino-4-deoxy-L-arabinose transferase-like glycosyltransferase